MSPATRAAALLLIASASTPAAALGQSRDSVALPVPAAAIASALKLPSADRATIVLNAVRLLHSAPDGVHEDGSRLRGGLIDLLRTSTRARHETVPLPLGTDAWTALLGDAARDGAIVTEILSDRSAGLLYYGVSALDGETQRALASDQETLAHLRRHAGTTAAFGRAIRIRDGRVVVPGGRDAEAMWQHAIGVSPTQPGRFIRSVFDGDRGRLAFFYDTMAHLDAAHLRFVFGDTSDAPRAAARLRDLADVFRDDAPDWNVELRPFSRPQFDVSIVLTAIAVDADGRPRGPTIGVLEQVFRDDSAIDVVFREATRRIAGANAQPDGAWLASHVALGPYLAGRRRLDAYTFGQRVLRDGGDPLVAASVLRAFLAMPALMLTLERIGITDARTLLAAARHAAALHAVGDTEDHRNGVAVFQSVVGLIERGVRSQAIAADRAEPLLASLVAIPIDRPRTYADSVARWLRGTLVAAAPPPDGDATDPMETAILGMIAGTRANRPRALVEWEGRPYHVDPAAAELMRLRRVRERQGGLSIDEAVAPLTKETRGDLTKARTAFADTLMTVLYAAHIGDPEGPALASENVAPRHAFEFTAVRPGVKSMTAWRLPIETFGGSTGWRVHGSLLGLDLALRRLSLRRLDLGLLPSGPKLPLLERHGVMLTTALMNPLRLTDEDRDRIALALARGRERYAAAKADPALFDAYAADAAMPALRREALRWSLANDADAAGRFVSLTDFFFAGAPQDAAAASLDDWGAAMLTLTGCVCLRMPARTAEDHLGGRPSAGLLATRGIDVVLRIVESLSRLKLPAALAPGVLAFAMQDVIDAASPAHFDDWQAFSLASKTLPDERLVDYIAALTADGPLVPAGAPR
jgi:hypothetical protein